MSTQARFPAASRLLHWLMAPMIVAMLFIGVGMAASVSPRYELLVAIHRPLGMAIFVLCVIRFVNRLINPPPELPDTVPSLQRFAAKASHIVLYALMFIMPLVGWGMLSAARYPIVLYGPLRLPPILPHDLTLYACSRAWRCGGKPFCDLLTVESPVSNLLKLVTHGPETVVSVTAGQRRLSGATPAQSLILLARQAGGD
jgi:cytochrome b561